MALDFSQYDYTFFPDVLELSGHAKGRLQQQNVMKAVSNIRQEVELELFNFQRSSRICHI